MFILRLRGRTDFGTTFLEVLRRYAVSLTAVGSTLELVSVSDRVFEQLEIAGVTQVIDADDVYLGDERVGATLLRAHADAVAWVGTRRV
jgi:sulfate permease, SulP family